MDIIHPVVIVAHIIFAIAMIAVVLLQTGKGAGLSGVFGAGGAASESFFGGRGPGTFLAKLTTVAAIMFMVTSLLLAKLSSMPRGGKSVMESQKKAPAERVPAAPSRPWKTEKPAEPAKAKAPAEKPPSSPK